LRFGCDYTRWLLGWLPGRLAGWLAGWLPAAACLPRWLAGCRQAIVNWTSRLVGVSKLKGQIIAQPTLTTNYQLNIPLW
jgi:hypothetical protein